MTASVQTNVRLPCEIKTWLVREAKRNRRSLSAEVTIRLEQSRHRQEAAGSDGGPRRRKDSHA